LVKNVNIKAPSALQALAKFIHIHGNHKVKSVKEC
jgi:hypothetical protein